MGLVVDWPPTDAAVYANSSAWTSLVTSCGNTCGLQMIVGPACATQCLHENSLGISLSADCAACGGDQSHCVVNNCLLECAADSTTPDCIACGDAACLDAFLNCSGISLVGAPPSAPPPTPSPSPSDLLDPPFGSSNSTFACNDADSKLYANTSTWVGFSLVCGLTCGVGAMLRSPFCVSHTGLESQTSRQVPCRAATHTCVSPALDRLLPVCATRCLSVVPTVHDALELRPCIRPLLCCLPSYHATGARRLGNLYNPNPHRNQVRRSITIAASMLASANVD